MLRKIFDIEVYPRWWCIVYNILGEDEYHVIRSDTPYKQDINEMCTQSCLIGFNIKHYDLRILNAIRHECDPYTLYELSQAIINDESYIFNDYSYWNKFNFSDLNDDWLFGSLKEFESNSGMNIKETDVDFDKEDLTAEEKELIIQYCINDVKATNKLYEYRKQYIGGKEVLADLFKIPLNRALKCTNAKLDSTILGASLITRPNRTDFVIPPKVKDYIYNNLPQEVIHLFDEINNEKKTVEIFDNTVIFGVGGIHSTYKENIICQSDDDYKLINIDVTSYYPNLMMNFNYISRNTPTPDLFKQIYNMRVKLKKQANEEKSKNGKTDLWKKLNAQQNGLKLVLNTTYGASKDEFNNLYDSYNASSLCYLGQLLLASLANKIWKNIKDCKIVQTNTDGILVKCPINKIDEMKIYVTEWEQLTGFTMEYDDVKKFIQRDVNNYIEVTYNDKAPYKVKGKWCNQYAYDPTDPTKTLSNLNAPITHLAILKYYTEDIPIEETINQCNDLYQFCFTTKRGSSYDKTYHIINNEMHLVNKVNRVVATTDVSYGTLKKYKKENERLDKVAEIPEHAFIVNETLDMIDHLDKQWYIDFAKNKLEELEWI